MSRIPFSVEDFISETVSEPEINPGLGSEVDLAKVL